MSKKLHVVYAGTGTGQKFDASFGVLVLQKAGEFWVKVREFDEQMKKLDEQIANRDAQEQSEYNKYLEVFNKKAADGWTEQEKETQKANERVRADTSKRWAAERDALVAKKRQIFSSYSDVKWCWQVVGEGLSPEDMGHNESAGLGIAYNYDTVNFPKLLEGGGLAWLEVFRDSDPATGKIPEGFYVQAIGTPRVIRTEWTDHECNPIKGGVAFGSEVLLNVYTEGMYGHELKIKLIDDDLFDPDDTLAFGAGDYFTVEVDIHRVKPAEAKKPGVGGLLTKEDDNLDGKVQQERFIQKSVVKVVVNPAWKLNAGPRLTIYPTVTSVKTGKPFEGFERTYLEVYLNGSPKYDDPSEEYPITPTFIGEVATNVSAFHPCKYDEIKFSPVPETPTAKTRIVFNKEKASVQRLDIPIICAGLDRMSDYTLTLVSLETKECRFADLNKHTGKTLPVKSAPENFKVVSNDGRDLKFQAGFNYNPGGGTAAAVSKYNLILNYIWPVSLPAANNKPLLVQADTCRYSKPVYILAYPDIKWTLDFRFGMKGPEQYTHTGLPSDDRRSDPTQGKPNTRFGEAQKKAIKAGRINTFGFTKKADGMELEFQLVLKAEFNKGDEVELAEKYSAKVKKFLDLLLSLKDGLDTITGVDKVNAGQKLAVKSAGKLLKMPITGTLDYPAISIGAKWQAAVDDATNELYTDGRLVLRLYPFIKGDISLDIIAAVTYVPAWGQVVRAIELALDVIGAELNFMLTFFGQLNVEAEYALAEKGGSNMNVNGEFGIKLVLSGKVKITKVIIWEVDDMELSAEANAVVSVKPKASLGHDRGGTFVEAKCDFAGVNVVLIGTAKWGKSSRQAKKVINVIKPKPNFMYGKGYIIS